MKKIAIFGDIHANWEALEAVIADAENEGCNGNYACLGDIVGYNANPVECLYRVMKLNCPTVRGNHDTESLRSNPLRGMNPSATAALKWTREQLFPSDVPEQLSDRNTTPHREGVQWLISRPLFTLNVNGEDYSIVHSSIDRPVQWNYVLNRFESSDSFEEMRNINIDLCFHGHTHVPKFFMQENNSAQISELPPTVVQMTPGNRYFINPGSVGQPRDGDSRASYAIYDQINRTVTLKRIDYDITTAQNKIKAAGLPEHLWKRLERGL